MQRSFYDPDRCTASGRITDQRDTDCQLDRHGADHGNMLLADQRTEGTEYFKKQAAAEWIVETADKFVLGNMGEKFRYLIPFVSALFATSVVSNLISLIGLRSPTADLSTEAAWAAVVFTMITAQKIKQTVWEGI